MTVVDSIEKCPLLFKNVGSVPVNGSSTFSYNHLVITLGRYVRSNKLSILMILTI